MTLGTDMSSLIGIAGSLFLTIRTKITKIKMDKISMLAGIGCAGGSGDT